MARAKHQRSKTTSGWAKLAPKTRQERRRVLARCGSKAFLEPGRLNSTLSFPVVAKNDGCVPDCEGIRAALARARQFHHGRVAMKAMAMGRKYKCRWAI